MPATPNFGDFGGPLRLGPPHNLKVVAGTAQLR